MPYYPQNLQDVAIYLRKSREDIQAEREARKRGESYDTLARHRRELLDIAHRNNYTIVDILEEVKSGERIDGRPQMMKLLENMHKGMYKAVLCIDTSRLSRGGLKDQGEIIETFQVTETMLVTAYEGLIDLETEEGESSLEMRGFVNRQVLKYTKKNLHAGRIRSVKEGRYVFTRPPYGYDIEPKTLRLVPNDNFRIVKMIKEWYLEENLNLGTGTIASRLNGMHIPSPSGDIWTHHSVITILKNIHYTGYLAIGKKKRRKYFDHESGRQREKARKVPADQWQLSRNQAHQEAWTLEERERILAKMNANLPIKQSYELQNPLAGLIKCGHCGRMMRRKTNARTPALVSCVCKKNSSTYLHIVEEKVLQELKHWLENYTVTIQEIQSSLPSRDETGTSAIQEMIRQKDNRLSQLEKQNARTHELLEIGEYDLETYRERKKAILEEMNRVREEIAAAHEELGRVNQVREARQEIIPTVVHVLETYNRASVKQKNNLLKQILEEIVYTKEKQKEVRLTLYIKIPELV
ncbi:recombinase family protein [Brevibacillus sp. FSL L8-0520]|uniref:recombinase family protein n=1 Tax=Brevibacillus sp. FSL L8-0520 TaxID=2954689 RepID=UPI0030D3CE0E